MAKVLPQALESRADAARLLVSAPKNCALRSIIMIFSVDEKPARLAVSEAAIHAMAVSYPAGVMSSASCEW